MTWAPQEAQKAIYETLSQDAALQSLLGTTVANPKVFDHIPDNQPFPFVRMSIKPMTDRANHDWDGVAFVYTIDVWTQEPNYGDLKVQQIQKRIDELLHQQDICIDGWNIIVHRRQTVDILEEPDGRTRHGIQTFRLFLGGI